MKLSSLNLREFQQLYEGKVIMFNKIKISFLMISFLSITTFSSLGNSVQIDNNTDTPFEVRYRITRYIPEQENIHFLVERRVNLKPQQQANFDPNESHLTWLNSPNIPPGTQYRLSLLIFADLDHDHAYAESHLMSLEEAIEHYSSGTIVVNLDESERYTFNLPQPRSEVELLEESAPLDLLDNDSSSCNFPRPLNNVERLSARGFPSKL